MVGGLSWGYVGPSWGYVGLSWGQCGPILGLCWPMLGLCWPILGLCWLILGLCWSSLGLSWPILGLCWPILRPMLAHLEAYVGPGWPILSHKIRKRRKNATSTKHRKTREFLATRGGRRLGRRPLSPTERRETPYGYATARGPLAGFKGCRPCRRPRTKKEVNLVLQTKQRSSWKAPRILQNAAIKPLVRALRGIWSEAAA